MNSDMFLLGLLFADFAQTLRPASPTAHPNLIYQSNFVSCLQTEEKSEKRPVLSLVNVRALNIKTSPKDFIIVPESDFCLHHKKHKWFLYERVI